MGTPTDPSGVPRAQSGQIAFGANESVILIDLAARSTVVLAAGGFPAWSPDGTMVAFSRSTAPDPELWVMNADGTGQAKIGLGFRPRWAPDGSRIAANGDPIDLGTLVVVGADGAGATLLSSTGGVSPSWSPDGTRIAFVRTRPGSGGAVPELALVDADGSDLRSLADAVDPDWSPDGRWIAASAWSSVSALLLVDPDTGERLTLVRLEAQVPAWSPDGARIAFVSNGNLYVATVADGTWIQITSGIPVLPGRPAWSPDGAWLAFTVGAAPATDLFVIGAEGLGQWRLTTGAGAGDPDWRPALP